MVSWVQPIFLARGTPTTKSTSARHADQAQAGPAMRQGHSGAVWLRPGA